MVSNFNLSFIKFFHGKNLVSIFLWKKNQFSSINILQFCLINQKVRG